ncbi:MAG TPA: NAD(P)-dependent oxidoreductase [Polyangiaceae bacterium]|nr:NAD(P)-dependent oxidoreductase [Polyangiaceae bacterium]
MKRIGFIGLGIMGSGMVKNLVRKGFSVSVWNRSPERCQQFGLPIANSPRDLAAATDVVVCCVSDPKAVERVVFAEDGVLAGVRPGFRYVECSTVSPELVRRISAAMAERGAAALEAPVTGSRLGAANGTLLFMTGGDPALHTELEPLLLAMGSRAIHCGDVGQGALMKLIGNTLISFMLEGLCEGLVVAEKGGLPIEKVLEVIAASGFASPYFAFKGGAIKERAFDTHFSIDLLYKDQSLMLSEAARQRTPLPALAAIREVFQAARGQGLGSEDISAVIKVLERAAGGGRARQ